MHPESNDKTLPELRKLWMFQLLYYSPGEGYSIVHVLETSAVFLSHWFVDTFTAVNTNQHRISSCQGKDTSYPKQ